MHIFRSASVRGFTLIEMAVVLVVIVILAAILTPLATNYVTQARIAVAQNDLATIANVISQFEKDTGRYPMFTSFASPLFQDSNARVVRLESTAGTYPTDNTAWTTNPVTDNDCAGSCTFNTFGGQLIVNSPGYPTTSSLAKPFKWKGPYFDVGADPWGHKYIVNIINAMNGSAEACFVLSAGPNGTVETTFNIAKTSAISAGGDDLIFRIK